MGGENVKKKKINLPLSYEVQNSFDSERFLKVRIKVMHSGLNLNNSYFTSEVIEKAKPTLANVPILAFIKKEDGTSNEDFAGHEFEIKITEDNVKYVYLGRPIGIIPETNNYEVEADDDGKQFVVVDGYIWKQYANSALDIINRDEVKKVSMEVIVNDYDWEETYINILDYSYTGIAMLGENVREAMIGAKAEIINYSKNTISDMMFELKEALKGGQENMTLEEQKQLEEQNTTEEKFEEEKVEETNLEPTEEKFEEETEEETTEETFEEEEVTKEETEEAEETNFEAQIAELQTQIEVLQTENARLAEFVNATQEKAKVDAIEEMFAKFEDLKEVEEAQTLREKAMELKLSDLENQLFALRGKHMSYSVKDDNKEQNEEPEKTDWKKLVTQYSVNESSSEPEWAELVRKAKKE